VTAPFRVGVLCSRRAPGLEDVLSDPNRGRLYEVAVCLSTDDAFPTGARAAAEGAGVPFVSHPIRALYRWLREPLTDLEVREVYDATSADLLRPFRCDILLLDGYRFRVTEPLLDAYPGRILGVHEADLTRRTETGAPRFRGPRGLHEAIVAGERETRATLYLVTEELDAGPALLRSWPFPVSPLVADGIRQDAREMVEAYASVHRQWVERTAFGPLMVHGMEGVAEGRVERGEGRFLVDGRPAPLDLVSPTAAFPARARLRWAV
jgi:folate-dependent phosphoribosylglycinamide formyltransferase PurN